MYRYRIFFIVSLIFLSGCTQLVKYQPTTSQTVEEALTEVESIINNNPMGKGIVLDFANERLIRLKGNLKRGLSSKIIGYDTIGNITFHIKRERSMINIYHIDRSHQYRVFFNDRRLAERLLDAIATLRGNKHNRYKKRLLQISYGGEVGLSTRIKKGKDGKRFDNENKRLRQQLSALKQHQNDLDDQGLSEKPLESEIAKVPLDTKKKDWGKKGIYFEEDDFEGITWYRDLIGKGIYGTRLSTHIGQKEKGKPWLVMKINYSDKSWLFVHSFTVRVDGQKYKFTNKVFKTDGGSGRVWEWLDERVGEKQLSMLKAISKADDVVIRFYGKTYFSDHQVSDDEKQGLIDVLKAYRELKNK